MKMFFSVDPDDLNVEYVAVKGKALNDMPKSVDMYDAHDKLIENEVNPDKDCRAGIVQNAWGSTLGVSQKTFDILDKLDGASQQAILLDMVKGFAGELESVLDDDEFLTDEN